jgi:hypothetical protein
MNAADIFTRTEWVGDCMEWVGGRSTHGYGRVNLGSYRYTHAHRVAYEQAHGPIPNGMVVRHTCDNPPCINPRHLVLGTQVDNARDAVERGRIRTGERSPAAKWPDSTVVAARRLRAEGKTYQAIADELGVTFWVVREWVARGLRNPDQPARSRR